jgi:hypothetical protein
VLSSGNRGARRQHGGGRKEERIGNREEETEDGGERELTEVHMGEGEMIVVVVGYKT